MLTLLGRTSSINVRKVLWTCAELELDIDRQDWGTGFRSTNEPGFLALNPNALVPVLVEPGDDGERDFVLWESNTICRYLAAQAGRTDLLPAAPRDRAEVERWMDWQAGDLNNAWRYAFLGLVRQSPAHQDAASIAASAAAWNRHMTLLDAQVARYGNFVVLGRFTLADIVLGLSIHRWRATPIARPPLPALDAYCDRLVSRPAFVQAGCGAYP